MYHPLENPTGPARLLQRPPVAATPLRHRLPPHGGPGTKEVRRPRLEHPLRVQPGGLPSLCTVYPEPPRRHGSEEGALISG